MLLPLANTTSELLARHVAQRLLDDLESRTGSRPRSVRIEVAESRGQSALCEIRL